METTNDTPPVTVTEPIEGATPPATVVPGVSMEASLGQRIGGVLIDMLIGFALYMVVGFVSSKLGWLVFIAYWLTRDSLPFLEGQSIGKKALKTKAVTEGGASLAGDWVPGLIRNAVLFIPFFSLVELIVLVMAKDKPGGLRRLGDQWAKTKVVVVDEVAPVV